MTPFDLVITADWSAAKGRKAKPSPDRCWVAWATRDHTARPEPIYAPTRLEAEAAILDILEQNSPKRRTLIGFDFAIGYPTATSGNPVLPIGRGLTTYLAERITDDDRGNNNRFEVAAEMNEHIKSVTGASTAPLWGRPATSPVDRIPIRKPDWPATAVNEYRACEQRCADLNLARPKSPWQLAGAGAVGSQSLVGLAAVGRLLDHPAIKDRAALWPFEANPDCPDPILIAEIFPSLYPHEEEPYASAHAIKDARQVAAARDALLDSPPDLEAIPKAARTEGWILGVPPE